MRIFSKQALRFDHPANQEKPVFVRASDFVDVPDWVSESTMFKLASAGENPTLSVINTKSQEAEAEASATKKGRTTKESE